MFPGLPRNSQSSLSWGFPGVSSWRVRPGTHPGAIHGASTTEAQAQAQPSDFQPRSPVTKCCSGSAQRGCSSQSHPSRYRCCCPNEPKVSQWNDPDFQHPPIASKEAGNSALLLGPLAVRDLAPTWRRRDTTLSFTGENFGQLQSRRERSLSQEVGFQSPECAWRGAQLTLASISEPPTQAQYSLHNIFLKDAEHYRYSLLSRSTVGTENTIWHDSYQSAEACNCDTSHSTKNSKILCFTCTLLSVICGENIFGSSLLYSDLKGSKKRLSCQMRMCETGKKCLQWITEQLPGQERKREMGGDIHLFLDVSCKCKNKREH